MTEMPATHDLQAARRTNRGPNGMGIGVSISGDRRDHEATTV